MTDARAIGGSARWLPRGLLKALGLGFAAGFGSAPLGHAQTAVPQTPAATAIEELVVRGSVRPDDSHRQALLQDLPIAGGATVAEQLALLPNVSLAGQGGRLQTFALRGLGGSRLRVLLDDVPLRGLRRAGVAAELAEPDWVHVSATAALQGSRYGLSAGGGVVSLRSELPQAAEVVAGLESNGQQRRLAIAGGRSASGVLGDFGYALGMAEAGDARAPDGTRLNSGFRQHRITLQHQKQHGEIAHLTTLRWLQGDDWGKSNSDFPQRQTVYPELSHRMLSHRAFLPGALQLTGWVHEQQLLTEVQQSGITTRTETEALDFGVRLQGFRQWGAWQAGYGLDHLARRNFAVSAQSAGALATPLLTDGADAETGLYLDLSQQLGSWQPEFGLRATRSVADANGFDEQSELLWAADAGLTWQANERHSVVLRAGVAHTAPTLSQRFYTGTTGRGESVANPGLRAERILGVDLAASLLTAIGRVDLSAYRLRVTEGIERQRLSGDAEQFVNVAERVLRGGHLGWQVMDFGRLQLTLVLQWHRDPLRDSGVLQEVAPLSGGLRLAQQLGSRWHIDWQGTFAQGQRSADRQQDVAGHFAYSAAVAYRSPRWSVSLFARNLGDRAYAQSHDRKAAFAPGRSAGIELRWGRG